MLPGFDGRRLDDLIDFLTYTCLPLALIWRAGLLSAPLQPWLLVPLVASAYGFCQVEAKTEDHYFLGFPSYWNIVAFYLYLLRAAGSRGRSPLVLALAVLTFVPARYLYTTACRPLDPADQRARPRPGSRRSWPSCGVVADGAAAGWCSRRSSFPAYYMLVSWAISIRYWRRPSPCISAIRTDAACRTPSAIPTGRLTELPCPRPPSLRRTARCRTTSRPNARSSGRS